MATKSKVPSEADRIKEAIRLLNLALDECHEYLAEVGEDVRQSQQDDEPSAGLR